jgi:hypothetical protein
MSKPRIDQIRQAAERLRAGRRFTKPFGETNMARYAYAHYHPGSPDVWYRDGDTVRPKNKLG